MILLEDWCWPYTSHTQEHVKEVDSSLPGISQVDSCICCLMRAKWVCAALWKMETKDKYRHHRMVWDSLCVYWSCCVKPGDCLTFFGSWPRHSYGTCVNSVCSFEEIISQVSVPEHPIIFTKAAGSLAAHMDTIKYPHGVQQFLRFYHLENVHVVQVLLHQSLSNMYVQFLIKLNRMLLQVWPMSLTTRVSLGWSLAKGGSIYHARTQESTFLGKQFWASTIRYTIIHSSLDSNSATAYSSVIMDLTVGDIFARWTVNKIRI